MSTYSILVVDDEPDNFDVLQSLLHDPSYKLHYAISGEQAIASLDKFNPDVILLDVMMPGMSGIEVCKEIKTMSKWEAVPTIMMVTALSAKEDLARCLAAGADDFVSKPVNGLELSARVNSMLRIKKQHDRLKSFSKLQRHNIHSLANNLNEIRLELAAEFSREFEYPLDIISETTEHLTQNIEQLSVAATLHILDQNHRSTLQLRKLMQKFWFYLQLVIEKPETNYDHPLIPKEIVLQSLTKRFQGAIPSNLICEIEEARLAVSIEHFQWICNELLEYVIGNAKPDSRTIIHGEIIDDIFHFSLSNYLRDAADISAIQMTKSIQFDTSTYEERELKIGLKIAKKLVNNYDGVFLLSSPDEEETTVYLTLPLVPERLPIEGSQLKRPTISVKG